MEMVKERDDLPLRQHALCVFGCFCGPPVGVLDQLPEPREHQCRFHPRKLYVGTPALRCEPKPQPNLQRHNKGGFTRWYSDMVCDAVKKGLPVEEIDIDLRLSHTGYSVL